MSQFQIFPEIRLKTTIRAMSMLISSELTAFNFGRPWRFFDKVFDEVLLKLKTYQKPIYILSTATAEGERKADWIYDFG